MTQCNDMACLLQRLCPMFLMLDGQGVVQHVGATLQKLRPDAPMTGRRFLDLFDVQRPRRVEQISDLADMGDVKLRLCFRDAPRTSLKGIIIPVPTGFVVNLSFGISLIDAVREYALTGADFSATDLAIELLYLVEAKSAAMEASRSLNKRLRGAMIAAEEQAFTDTLTGLKNRRALDHVLSRLSGSGRDYAIMNLDLDFFKSVNDTLGHAAGDHVLQHVAGIMVEETRNDDTVARTGGDEFILVFDQVQDQTVLERIAGRLIERIERPIPYEGQICKVSASIGIAMTQLRLDQTPAQLIHHADMALYAAKNAGRAAWRVFDPVMMQEGAPAKATPDLSEAEDLDLRHG